MSENSVANIGKRWTNARKYCRRLTNIKTKCLISVKKLSKKHVIYRENTKKRFKILLPIEKYQKDTKKDIFPFEIMKNVSKRPC